MYDHLEYIISVTPEYNVELEATIMEVIRVLLPTKYIHKERTVIMAGARLIHLLEEPLTVTQLWDYYKNQQNSLKRPMVPFDLFILTLDFLYSIGVIEFKREKLRRIILD